MQHTVHSQVPFLNFFNHIIQLLFNCASISQKDYHNDQEVEYCTTPVPEYSRTVRTMREHQLIRFPLTPTIRVRQ